MKYTLYLLSIILLMLSSCAHESIKREPVFTISRGSCEGTCPIYNAVIFNTGEVEYEGIDFVKLKGKRKFLISENIISKMALKFNEAGYYSMRDEYDHKEELIGGVRFSVKSYDSPITVTSLNYFNKYKKIINQCGAPETLVNLEFELEDISGLSKLVR